MVRNAGGRAIPQLKKKPWWLIEYAFLKPPASCLGIPVTIPYCLWVTGEIQGKGYGSTMDYHLVDAKKRESSGICMLGAEQKQKSWLSDQSFAKKYGFEVVMSLITGTICLRFLWMAQSPDLLQCENRENRVSGVDHLLQPSMPLYLPVSGKNQTVPEMNAVPVSFIHGIPVKAKGCPVCSTTGLYSTKGISRR